MSDKTPQRHFADLIDRLRHLVDQSWREREQTVGLPLTDWPPLRCGKQTLDRLGSDDPRMADAREALNRVSDEVALRFLRDVLYVKYESEKEASAPKAIAEN